MADEHLYPIRTLDQSNNPLGLVSIHAESPNGEWNGMTDECGWFIPYLTPGHYSVSFTKSGYETAQREWDLLRNPSSPILVGLVKEVGKFPPIPYRAQVCAIQTSLQGLTYHTKQYGDIPAWFYAGLNAEDRAIARQDHRNQGDTHVHLSISAAYKQEGTLWPAELREGYDFTQNLEGLRAICIETICDGLLIDMPLAGDGLGMGPDYNDPVGHTYGHGWLVANLERILVALVGDGSKQSVTGDLTDYIIFRPGWDAVFYGWGGAENGETPTQPGLDEQQVRIRDLGRQFRLILPNGYLALEHTPGNIPVGLGPQDYDIDGLMSTYDTLMGEYATVHENSFWQVLARMQRPFYRPSDMPANNPDGTPNDPNPPHYTAQGTPRGPYFYIAYEPTTGGVYEWCRGRCSLEQVREVDSYMRSCGAMYTGFTQ